MGEFTCQSTSTPTAMPLMDVVRLDTMVTVVDSGVFLDAYTSRDKLAKRPELGACDVCRSIRVSRPLVDGWWCSAFHI